MLNKNTKYQEFAECCICQHFGPLVRKWQDGNYYCKIHLNDKKDEITDKNMERKATRWLERFRALKETTLNT